MQKTDGSLPPNSTQSSPSETGGSTFEQSLKALEAIVADLEKGQQPLEDQLKSFEKGVSLSRDCMTRLEEVERRVEVLMQNAEGKLTTTPFEVTARD